MTALIPQRVWESGWTPAVSCTILFIIIILIIYNSPATGEKGNCRQVHSKFKDWPGGLVSSDENQRSSGGWGKGTWWLEGLQKPWLHGQEGKHEVRD